MKTSVINTIVNYISSQYLMRENDINDFRSWMIAGNYDDEIDEIIMKYGHGERISISEISTCAFDAFCK